MWEYANLQFIKANISYNIARKELNTTIIQFYDFVKHLAVHLYTAIPRKVVGNKVQATILKDIVGTLKSRGF